jgi:ADP-ribosylglycohydrolase
MRIPARPLFMPSPQSRLAAAIWGQFLGDAASLGSHWIYDLEEIKRRFPGGVQGFETPAPGHYHEGKQGGDLTHYGDAALLALESLAACGGEFRESDFGVRFRGFFGSSMCKSYRDHATRETLERMSAEPDNFQNGAYDDQSATVTRMAPVVVAYHKRSLEEMLEAVRRLTRLTQNHPTALGCTAAHAVLLRQLLEGLPFMAAFENTRKSREVSCDASDYFEFAHMLREFDAETATARIGQGCPLPQTLPAALHAACRHHEDFTTAILATLRAGGDSAGRAAMIGAWMGAVHGMEGIPAEWLSRLNARERIQKALDQLDVRLGVEWQA